jgi:hypothetical protein
MSMPIVEAFELNNATGDTGAAAERRRLVGIIVTTRMNHD